MTERRYVPIEHETVAIVRSSIEALDPRALREAIEALIERAGDLQIEAAQRLRERGASEAQIERLEHGTQETIARLRARLTAHERAIAETRRAAQELADV